VIPRPPAVRPVGQKKTPRPVSQGRGVRPAVPPCLADPRGAAHSPAARPGGRTACRCHGRCPAAATAGRWGPVRAAARGGCSPDRTAGLAPSPARFGPVARVLVPVYAIDATL